MEKENKIFDFNNFLDFLKSVNYANLNSQISMKELILLKEVIENPNLNIFTDNLEENTTIEKTKELIIECHQLYGIYGINLKVLYDYYLEMHFNLYPQKPEMGFAEFRSLLTILNYLMNSLNNKLFKIEFSKIFDNGVIIFFLDETENLNSRVKEILNVLMGKFSSKISSSLNNNQIINSELSDASESKQTLSSSRIDENTIIEIKKYRDLIYFIFLFTLGNKISINNKNKIKSENLISNFLYYSKCYFSHLDFFLLSHFLIIFLFHLFIKEEITQNLTNTLFTKKNSQKFSSSDFITKFQNPETFPILYIVEDLVTKDFEEEAMRVILFSNTCKYFCYSYFNSIEKNINYKNNSSFEIKFNIKSLKTDFLLNTLFYYEFSSNDVSNGLKLKNSNLIPIEEIPFISYKNFLLHDVLINLRKGILNYEIQKLFQKYSKIFLKAYSISFKDSQSDRTDYISVEYFNSEMEIINQLILNIYNIFKIKKKKKENLFFEIKLNTIDLLYKHEPNLFQISNQIRGNLRLYFDYQNIREVELIKFLNEISFFTKFNSCVRDLISVLLKFKKFNIHVSLMKNTSSKVNYTSELKYILNLLSLSLNNYFIEEKGNKNIIFIETLQNISPKFTTIINALNKESTRKTELIKYLKKMQNPSFSILNKFSDLIVNYFSEIVIHDKIDNNFAFNPNILLREFKNSKLIIINNLNNYLTLEIYLNIIIKGLTFCQNDKFVLKNTIDLISNFRKEKSLQIKDINIILTKFILEHIIKEKLLNLILEISDKIFIVKSNSTLLQNSNLNPLTSELDYDILITEKKLCFINHKQMKFSKNKLLQSEMKEMKFRKIIFEFCEILSDSMEENCLVEILQSKERYFYNILLIFLGKKHFKCLDISDGNIILGKLISNNIFSEGDLIFKGKNIIPKFGFYFIPNLTLKDIFTTLLKEFLENFRNILNKNKNPNKNQEDEMILATFKLFFSFLDINFLVNDIRGMKIIAYDTKYFLDFFLIFQNFINPNNENKKTKFEEILLLVDSHDFEPAQFLQSFKHYFPDTEQSLNLVNTISVYQTEVLKEKKFDMNEFLPFRPSKLEQTLQFLLSTYQKKEISFSSLHINQQKNHLNENLELYALFHAIKNSKLLKKLQIRKVNETLYLLLSKSNNTKINFYYSKNFLKTALIDQMITEKSETAQKNETLGEKEEDKISPGKKKKRKFLRRDSKCKLY
jgi:hypothetical protein